MSGPAASGPLAGIRVVELAGLGPGPWACMVLADMGAEVVRIDRGGDGLYPGGTRDVVARGRRSIGVDLKQTEGLAVVMDLVERADVLLEGFRPGVTERLGLGPEACLERNPRLVYCRMTGWGQDGPLATTAGHDITYLARSGNLARFRRAGEKPVPPTNLLGDFGGGSMPALAGILAALVARATTGRGQVVDAAIVDGVGYLATFLTGLERMGTWGAPPGANLLDTGAPFYEVYACADDDPSAPTGRWVAVGALEEKFYAELLRLTDARAFVDDTEWDLISPERRFDPAGWPAGKAVWARVFASRTRDEWAAAFKGSDACVEPVLSPDEAAADPAALARGTTVATDDGPVPTPAPRLSDTPLTVAGPSPAPGADTDAVLRDLGRTGDQVAALRARGAVR
ncbi:CaiB/BaiF CoA transferase family protein [Jatrophihabitans sp. YIM 134969]